MAAPRDSDPSRRRSRANGAEPTPVGARDDAPASLQNSVTEAAAHEVGRTQRERAARQAQNIIQAAAAEGTSQRSTAPDRASARRSPPDPIRDVIPEGVIERYSRVGNDYRFADGNVAFRDEGRRLSTQLDNREVIRDLIAIAQARGWNVEISGTKEFQRRAWQEAQVAGLTVRNYEPSELERQQLARRLSRERPAGAEAAAATAPNSAADTPGTATGKSAARDPASPAVAADRIHRGRLVDHGIDRYQFDPLQDESYFVILDTADRGEQIIWGKDLQRALEQSLSKPGEGEAVVVRQLGARPVTVSRPVRDADGQVVTQNQVKTHLNRWLVETEEFLREREKLADVVRDVGIDPKRAVAQHPELAGTYSELHAARLVALQQNYRHPADLERFVNRTREAIAQEIERGEALSPPLNRARYHGSPLQRTQDRQHERTL